MDSAKCPHCGGSSIVENISVGQNAEVGKIGLSYSTAKILVGTEPLLADLCSDCGSVTRLHVRNVDHPWKTNP